MKRTNTKWWAAKSSESEVCGHTSAFVALPPLRIMTRFWVHCSFLLCTNCASLWNFEVGVTENRIIVKPRRVRYVGLLQICYSKWEAEAEMWPQSLRRPFVSYHWCAQEWRRATAASILLSKETIKLIIPTRGSWRSLTVFYSVFESLEDNAGRE